MEIIDKFGLDWKVFLAEVVNFLILLAILTYFFYKKIFSVVDERQKKINEGLDKAEKAEELIKKAEEEKKDIISNARLEAEEKIKKSIELGKSKKEDIIKKAKEEKDLILEKTKKSAEEEPRKIIDSSKEEITKMVVLAAEKVLAEK